MPIHEMNLEVFTVFLLYILFVLIKTRDVILYISLTVLLDWIVYSAIIFVVGAVTFAYYNDKTFSCFDCTMEIL